MIVNSRPEALALAGAIALSVVAMENIYVLPAMIDKMREQTEDDASDEIAQMMGSFVLLLGLPRDTPINQINWQQAKKGVAISHLKSVMSELHQQWNLI